jgi:hypothetical protein
MKSLKENYVCWRKIQLRFSSLFHFILFFSLRLKTSIIFVNESWNSEVETSDVELPDALSSLTICFVGTREKRYHNFSLASWKLFLTTSTRICLQTYQKNYFWNSRSVENWVPDWHNMFKWTDKLSNSVFFYSTHRYIFSASDFPINRWQHSRMHSHLHRTKSQTNWQSIFGFVSHCRSVCRISCDDICWREWHSRWEFDMPINWSLLHCWPLMEIS